MMSSAAVEIIPRWPVEYFCEVVALGVGELVETLSQGDFQESAGKVEQLTDLM